MIITRSPLRISIAGGGTDLKSFYSKYGSTFISAAINSYVYVSINKPFIDKFILKYSKIEKSKNPKKFRHGLFREIINKFSFKKEFLEITTTADVPYGTGLGSSGAFSNALIKAITTYNKQHLTFNEIAEQSYDIENRVLKETAGKQDPYISAYGGISKFSINKKGLVNCDKLNLSSSNINKLNDNLLLFFTGFSRSSSTILKQQDINTKKQNIRMIKNLAQTQKDVFKIEKYLLEGKFDEFGYSMLEHWKRKKERSNLMSNNQVDDLYEQAINNGAIGGKIVGAGGGGFLLFYTNHPDKLRYFFKKKKIKELRFSFDFEGTKNLFVKI